MKRYIDGREFIQNLSGKWEPSPYQVKLDKDKAVLAGAVGVLIGESISGCK